MKVYYDKNTKNEDLESIDDFWATLKSVYGQHDTTEGARKKLEALFGNKTLAHKDFVKYAERFQVLANASKGEFTNKHLVVEVAMTPYFLFTIPSLDNSFLNVPSCLNVPFCLDVTY